jgi:hypothetical protein
MLGLLSLIVAGGVLALTGQAFAPASAAGEADAWIAAGTWTPTRPRTATRTPTRRPGTWTPTRPPPTRTRTRTPTPTRPPGTWTPTLHPPTSTRTPTATDTETATLTHLPPTPTPTISPTARPNYNGTGFCWSSGASWPGYSVGYSLNVNIPSTWIDAIHMSAIAWTDVTPSLFAFYDSPGSSNTIRIDHIDDGSVEITGRVEDSTTISMAWTIFNEEYTFDPNNPPSSDKYGVQNVMTHEFGHWLRLIDKYDGVCSVATMYAYVYLGESQKTDLEPPDIEGINWQYP